MKRLVPLLFLCGCFSVPTFATAPTPPRVTASLTNDGVDPPSLDFTLCRAAFLLGCDATGDNDDVTVCDGAGCRRFELTPPSGIGGEDLTTPVTLSASPVHVAWDGPNAKGGLSLTLPDAFSPTVDQSTYAATDTVKITWAPSQANLKMWYSLDTECDTSGSWDPSIAVEALGTADPGELDLMASALGSPGETCHVTLTLVRELPAELDGSEAQSQIDAGGRQARAVTFTVTE